MFIRINIIQDICIFRYEKVQSELRRLEEAEAYNRDTRKIKEENERLRDRLEKTMNELDTLRNTIQFDQESFEKLKERIGQRENDAQSLEAKLHEATLQLERSRSEIAKLISNQVSYICVQQYVANTQFCVIINRKKKKENLKEHTLNMKK